MNMTERSLRVPANETSLTGGTCAGQPFVHSGGHPCTHVSGTGHAPPSHGPGWQVLSITHADGGQASVQASGAAVRRRLRLRRFPRQRPLRYLGTSFAFCGWDPHAASSAWVNPPPYGSDV